MWTHRSVYQGKPTYPLRSHPTSLPRHRVCYWWLNTLWKCYTREGRRFNYFRKPRITLPSHGTTTVELLVFRIHTPGDEVYIHVVSVSTIISLPSQGRIAVDFNSVKLIKLYIKSTVRDDSYEVRLLKR